MGREKSVFTHQSATNQHRFSLRQLFQKGDTIMGKTADLTVVQRTTIDTLHKEGKTQTFIAKEAGCSQSAVSKHVNRKLSGRKKCGRKRCTTNRKNRSLERPVKQNRFKNLGELHKEWTEAGVKALRATTHRCVKEFGYSCRIPLFNPLLNHRQCQRRLTWATKKKKWTVAQWSKVLFSERASFVFHLETKVLESGGRPGVSGEIRITLVMIKTAGIRQGVTGRPQRPGPDPAVMNGSAVPSREALLMQSQRS
ncbi:hypothetical protein H4Q32_015398 [Labeo rohita]|uniref:Transposase Tc1-like domain-containing protein n=1 Tax=Labeo rohita TaxID=84645 RepID=A0ABQ8LFH2_LABRO|nr:hypothetical protein H4Q32_015398 [Labeo rohita]